MHALSVLCNSVCARAPIDPVLSWSLEKHIMFMKETFVMKSLGALAEWIKRLRRVTTEVWHLVTGGQVRPGTWGLRTGDLYKHYTDITHGHSPLTIGRTQLTQNTRPGPSPPPGSSVLCIQLHFADCRLELQHKYEKSMICLFSRSSNRTTIR